MPFNAINDCIPIQLESLPNHLFLFSQDISVYYSKLHHNYVEWWKVFVRIYGNTMQNGIYYYMARLRITLQFYKQTGMYRMRNIKINYPDNEDPTHAADDYDQAIQEADQMVPQL